jgi:hypothetical protein
VGADEAPDGSPAPLPADRGAQSTPKRGARKRRISIDAHSKSSSLYAMQMASVRRRPAAAARCRRPAC